MVGVVRLKDRDGRLVVLQALQVRMLEVVMQHRAGVKGCEQRKVCKVDAVGSSNPLQPPGVGPFPTFTAVHDDRDSLGNLEVPENRPPGSSTHRNDLGQVRLERLLGSGQHPEGWVDHQPLDRPGGWRVAIQQVLRRPELEPLTWHAGICLVR